MPITLNGTTGITTPEIISGDVEIYSPTAGAVNSSIQYFGSSALPRAAAIYSKTDTSTAGNFILATAQSGTGTITERMRIDSAGNVGVGTTTTTNAALNVSPTTATYTGYFSGTSGGQNLACRATVNGNAIRFLNTSGTDVGRISSNTTATAYATSSDYRLKENIQPMTGTLSLIAQLNPVTYTWKSDGSDGQGFIAHELQAVIPDCVIGEKDAVDAEGNPQYQGVDTSFLVATLVKAIQELTARIEALETTQ